MSISQPLAASIVMTAATGWYYQSINDVIDNDGDMLTLLDVLAQDVGVIGCFPTGRRR